MSLQKRKLGNWFLWSLMLGLALVPHPALAQVCSLCKVALIHSPEGRRLVKAFNDGILFLLAMPFLVSAVLFFLIRKLQRTGLSETP